MPTRAFGSASKDCHNSRSRRAVRASIALRASGRFRRKIRTGPSAEMRTGRAKVSGDEGVDELDPFKSASVLKVLRIHSGEAVNFGGRPDQCVPERQAVLFN